MEDDRAVELEGERELGLEQLAHERRYLAALKAVKPYLTDPGMGMLEKGLTKIGQIRVD